MTYKTKRFGAEFRTFILNRVLNLNFIQSFYLLSFIFLPCFPVLHTSYPIVNVQLRGHLQYHPSIFFLYSCQLVPLYSEIPVYAILPSHFLFIFWSHANWISFIHLLCHFLFFHSVYMRTNIFDPLYNLCVYS